MENKNQPKHRPPQIKESVRETHKENIKEIDVEIMNLFAEMKLYSVKEEKPETFGNIQSKVKILKEMKKVLFNFVAN